ncbi:MAG: antitoxin VapB family protein [Candidatus Woesearchaeota archaeon]
MAHLPVSEELYAALEEHRSEGESFEQVIWRLIEHADRSERTTLFDGFAKDSELTEDDVLELGRKARRRQ